MDFISPVDLIFISVQSESLEIKPSTSTMLPVGKFFRDDSSLKEKLLNFRLPSSSQSAIKDFSSKLIQFGFALLKRKISKWNIFT